MLPVSLARADPQRIARKEEDRHREKERRRIGGGRVGGGAGEGRGTCGDQIVRGS